MSATRLDGIVVLEENEQIVRIGRSKPFTKMILTNKRLLEATSRSILSEHKLENIDRVSKTRGHIYFAVYVVGYVCLSSSLITVPNIGNEILIALGFVMIPWGFVVGLAMPMGIRVKLRGGSTRRIPTYTPKKWIDTINEYRLRTI
jgi:hypothetical protein